MGFSHGKNTKVLANGVALTSYLRESSVDRGAEAVDVTAFGDPAKKYLAGQQSATYNAAGMFEGTALAVDNIVDTALGQDGGELVYLPEGDAAGKFGFGLQGIVSEYQVTSPVDDVVQVSLAAESCVGAERVVSLAALAAYASDTDVASVDNGASTAAGASAYLFVTGLSAGSVIVKVQHSADNSVWADLITFSSVTSSDDPISLRAATAAGATVNRYARLSVDVTGGTPTLWAGLSRTPKNL
jgi:hypothetical protein